MLLTYNEIPNYLKDNEFVATGWRPEMPVKAALLTFFKWHNESLNIWTHAAACFAMIAWSVALPRPILAIYQIGVASLFVISTSFHLLCCVSEARFSGMRKLDFMAIIFAMWSMFPPFLFHMWGADSVERWTYLGACSAVAVGSATIALMPAFQTNEFHVMRVLTFAGNGALGVAVLLHICITQTHCDAPYVALGSVGLHAIAAAFYASKMPERYSRWRGWHYLQSHTFFHIFVILGFGVYSFALERMMMVC